jgi:ubiquitin-protein ligase E3 A
LLVAPELSHAGVRGAVLETLQRCALDVADQLLRCVTSSTPSALSGTSSIWTEALRVVVLLLVAPTSATQTARAFNTRTRLCTSLSRLAATRRQLLYEWLLIGSTARDDAAGPDALAERERVWLGSAAAGEKSTAFGRAVGTLRAHHESLLGDDAARNEREAIVCTRLLAELFAFNEQHALMPRAAFNNATIDRMSDAELLAHYQRWQTPNNTQWTFLSQPFLLSLDVKRRVLRIEELLTQQSHVGMAAFSELTTTGQLSATTLRCAITVRRDNLLEDALEQLRLASTENRLKRPLFVQFAGEAGVDEGGVRKEFFQLALRALLREEYGMFVRQPGTGRYWLRTCDFPDSRGLFELSGMLIGLALYNNVLLEARFPVALWRKLLAPETEHLDDLASLGTVYPEVARNLQTLLEYAGDVEQDFDLNFTVTQDVFGATKTHALLADGANVPVTNRNRERYVQLFADWQLNGSVAPQFEAFRRGFLAAAGGNALTLLSASELEQLVCGADDSLYDLSLLRRHVRYEGGYDDSSPTIAAFWKAVTPSPAELAAAKHRREQLAQQAGWSADHEDEATPAASVAAAAADDGEKRLTAEERRRLLAFMTGSDRVPMDGLGEMRVMIQKNGAEANRFVTSATCFNLLLLPDYNDEGALLRNLRIAAEHSEGFGMQ